MSRRRQRFIQINKLRGLSNPENISVQSDGLYNNPIYSGVETPVRTPGFKSRIHPPYPQRVVKGD